ncbi:hypothetical protein C8Q76DRAFT_736654 [Earliella scabrosa]|nr:hypothetical protein C8Q76DRAFT_736654 [Earliella scabrosa]
MSLPQGITVPKHFGLSLEQFSCLTADAGLYAINIMQMYLYFLGQHRQDRPIVKLFILALWVIETVQLVLVARGSWALVVEYWRPHSALATEFLWSRFFTILTIVSTQLYFAVHLHKVIAASKSGLSWFVPVVLSLGSLFQLAGYIVVLVLSLKDLEPTLASGVRCLSASVCSDIPRLSKAVWTVCAVENLAITGLLVVFPSNATGVKKSTSLSNLLTRIAYGISTVGTVYTMCTIATMISVYAAPDLELYSAFAMILCPLAISFLLANLNGRPSPTSGMPQVVYNKSMSFNCPPGQETTAGDDTLDSTLNYSFAQSTKVANQSKEVILP